MKNLKKKILAGILSGAIIMTGGLAVTDAAADKHNDRPHFEQFDGGKGGPHFGQFDEKHEHKQLTEEQIANFSKEIASRYGVSQTEVAAALRENNHFGDIKHAATLAKLSGKSFAEVLAMKSDWHEVAEKLGVTREQFDAFMKNEMLTDLAQKSKLDKSTVENLLKDNYDPRDICVAGLIANVSGKNVKNVLAKRKINNSWEDVAKEFNVDLQKIFDSGDKPQHRPHRSK